MNADLTKRDPETHPVIGLANHLRITQLPRGLLISFGADSLESKRLVLSSEKNCVNLRIDPMFTYPKQAEFNRVVPKTKIYAHTRVSKRVRELFVSQVGEIVWRYKLSPETLNLPARNGIREIQVFDIHLKTPEIDDAVLVAIDKAIPFPLVLQLFRETRLIASVVPYKRPSESDSAKWVTEKLFKVEGTEGKVEGRRQKDEGNSGGEAAKKTLQPSSFNLHPLPVSLDLASLYEQIVRRHIRIPARNGESLAEHVARFLMLEAKQREKEQMEARLAKEKQFNRKVELNAALRSVIGELNQALS